MTGDRALAHYEVVVAINRRARQLLTLDPARGLRENTLAASRANGRRRDGSR